MNFAKLESNTERFQFLEKLTLKCFRQDGARLSGDRSVWVALSHGMPRDVEMALQRVFCPLLWAAFSLASCKKRPPSGPLEVYDCRESPELKWLAMEAAKFQRFGAEPRI